MILFFLLSCSTVQRSNTPHGEQCIVHDHLYRCWNSHVPSDVPENPPLVIDMHYWTGDAEDQRQLSGFEALSDSEGFIVVWPYGLNLSWNSGPACCEPSSMDGTDDVGFIRELVAEIAQQYPIDLNRVYVTGLSNGCSMSQRLANEASDLVAAAACMAMNLVVPPAENYTPVSVMNLMGTADDLYSESEDGFPGSISNLNTWKMMNNCIGAPVETSIEGGNITSYQECDEGTEISLVTVDDGGHFLYPGAESTVDTTTLAWEFLQRFSKPTE